jgi:hypothetical protein
MLKWISKLQAQIQLKIYLRKFKEKITKISKIVGQSNTAGHTKLL